MDHANSGDPRDAAAAWFAYLQSGEATDEGRQAFERWRRADPEHERQYRSVERIWGATLEIPAQELRALLSRPDPGGERVRRVRRRRLLILAGGCAAALVGGVAVRRAWFEPPDHTIDLASRRGERRQLTLPDGSVLHMNTGSLAQARMSEHERAVDLRAGEIFFSVRHDPRRPFVVNAGSSRIVVTGTRFNVRHDTGLVQVSVASGSVDVLHGAWWRRDIRSLRGGQAVEVDAESRLGNIHFVDIDKRLAWQRGKIVFENTPLAQAVAEVNRYLERPARLDAPALRDYRIAGVFSADDPLSLIDALPDVAPVRVLRLTDGRIRILPA